MLGWVDAWVDGCVAGSLVAGTLVAGTDDEDAGSVCTEETGIDTEEDGAVGSVGVFMR